jgi:hypothetical protein
MTTCNRFETEGLEHFVAGEPLDAHFESCTDCRSTRASYVAVVRTLGEAGRTYAPPGDWEARVLARIQRRRPVRRRFFLGLAAALPVAAAAVLVLRSTGGVEALDLDVSVSHGGGPAVRGGASGNGAVPSAAPGDVLHLVARVPRGKSGDLRLYRGDALVFQCLGSPRCTVTRDGLSADVSLEKAGTYRTLSLAAEHEVPPATGSLDADYAAALRAGEARQSPPIEVL